MSDVEGIEGIGFDGVRFSKYDDSGRILFSGIVPESMIGLQGENVWIGEADSLTQYIVDGQLVPRPPLPVAMACNTVRANGVDEVVFASVPSGTLVRALGPAEMTGTTEIDGDVTMTFALAGRYEIMMDNFPFQNLRVMIHAI